jgi:hypothetical protein
MVNVLLFAALIPLSITIASYSIKSSAYRLGLLSVPFWAIYGAYCYSFTDSSTAFTTWYGYLGFVSILYAIIMLIMMNRMRTKQSNAEKKEIEETPEDEFADFELSDRVSKRDEIKSKAKRRREDNALRIK